jgi:hypothetical protein
MAKELDYLALVGAITQHFPDRGDEYRADIHDTVFLLKFMHWLPDLIRHQAAEDLRNMGALPHLASEIDPFERHGFWSENWHWRRKSDLVVVPEHLLPKEVN